MADISLRHIYKVYDGGVKAVNDFNLEINDKEFVVLVGPSGCGKSTTLRMIAGLEKITSGELFIDGKLINDVEPKNRDITMVFQNYALYPHMSVYDNMAFGLRQINTPKEEIDEKIKNAAKILGIEDLLTRKPKQLSGGQRQRVALGRSIVREPKVFLLDEPLSNLDAKLRVQMRSEITKLHAKLKTTFVYVTHDQTEAMTMGTKIVVMKLGVIQQVDTPKNLYDFPNNVFVATFLGSPQMNIFDAKLIEEGNKVYALIEGKYKVNIPNNKIKQLRSEKYLNSNILFGVRPEDIHEVSDNQTVENIYKLHVEVVELLGTQTIVYGKLDGVGKDIVVALNPRINVRVGDKIDIYIDNKRIHLFDKESEERIIDLPTYNKLNASLVIKDKQADVKFNEFYQISLPNDNLMSIVPEKRIDSKIKFSFKPSALKMEKIDNSLELNIKIDFIEETSNANILYGYVSYSNDIIAVVVDKNVIYHVGDEIKTYLSFDDVCFFNGEERISAKYPLLDTEFDINVVSNNNNVSFKVLDKNIKINNSNLKDGKYKLIVPSEAISIGKGRYTFDVRAINEDKFKPYNVIYLKHKLLDGYISTIADESISIFAQSKHKICIDFGKCKFLKMEE